MAVEILFQTITDIIASGGYAGIFFLMALESMIAPVPSEAVMPFAGFLAFQGKFDFFLALLAASLGSIAGSAISYWAGKSGGKIFIENVGKYLFLNSGHLEITEGFFNSHGGKTIFISRFIPVVRHLISIPAGVGKMHFGKFIFLTAIGATAWNAILLYSGILLGQNWEIVAENMKIIDIGILILIFSGVVWFVWRKLKK